MDALRLANEMDALRLAWKTYCGALEAYSIALTQGTQSELDAARDAWFAAEDAYNVVYDDFFGVGGPRRCSS